MDTAMVHSEGDMDQTGKTLLTYGTLDEYLTGEHDKMVKYIWRFQSPTRIVFEVNDPLPWKLLCMAEEKFPASGPLTMSPPVAVLTVEGQCVTRVTH